MKQLQDLISNNPRLQSLINLLSTKSQQQDALGDAGNINGRIPSNMQDEQDLRNAVPSDTSNQDTPPQQSVQQLGQEDQQPQNMNDILNLMASGQGGIDYQQLGQNYPTPRPPAEPAPNQDAYNYMMSGSRSGDSPGATIGRAIAYAKTQELARQNAQNQALDTRDVGAFNAMTGLAHQSGNIQATNNKINQLSDYRANQIDMAQQRLEEAIRQHDKMREPEGKPLSGDVEKQIGLSFDQFLGVRDEKGNMLDADKAIDPTQRNQVLTATESYLQQNPSVGVHGALGHVINELGGVTNITEAKTHLFRANEPRRFTNIDTINQQRAALSNAAKSIGTNGAPIPPNNALPTPATAPAGAPIAPQGQMTPPNMIPVAQPTAPSPGQMPQDPQSRIKDLVAGYLKQFPNASHQDIQKAYARATSMVGQ